MPNSFRFLRGANQDNTLRTATQDSLSIAYAATIGITPVTTDNLYVIGQLTGALTMNATVTGLYIGDKVSVLLSSDASARVVTFGTNFLSAGTLSVTGTKTAYADFVFDGTNLREMGRTVTA